MSQPNYSALSVTAATIIREVLEIMPMSHLVVAAAGCKLCSGSCAGYSLGSGVIDFTFGFGLVVAIAARIVFVMGTLVRKVFVAVVEVGVAVAFGC